MAKRKGGKRRRSGARAPRAGMPAKDSVREIIPKVSPTGMKYRILRTNEMDSYDKPPGARKKKGRS